MSANTPSGPRTMLFRDLAEHVAISYAEFAVEHEGQQIVPLDRAYAFREAHGLVERGQYKATTRASGVDWDRVARHARRSLPRWIRVARTAKVRTPEGYLPTTVTGVPDMTNLIVL